MRRSSVLICLALLLAALTACSAAEASAAQPEPSPAPLLEVIEETASAKAEPAADIPPTAQHVPGAPWTPYPPGVYGAETEIPIGEYILLPLSAEVTPSYEIIDRVLETAGCGLAFNTIRFTGCAIVTLGELQRLRLKDCYAVPYDQLTRPVDGDEGMFHVGDHLPAGEYELQSAGDASGVYEIAKDSCHATDSVLDTQEFTGTVTITVEEGQYLTLSRCTVTRRPA